jgi:hypothetical protein
MRTKETGVVANVAADQKRFLFLYPQTDIIEFEIRRDSYCYLGELNSERMGALNRKFDGADEPGRRRIKEEILAAMTKEYGILYEATMNACIDARYRKKGFSVCFALLDDTEISNRIELHPEDRIIHVGMDAKTHRTKLDDGSYPYPDDDVILDRLGSSSLLMVGGFHLFDCVDRIARRAYERGMNVLVDEDLTQFLGFMRKEPGFRVDRYPNFNPRAGGQGAFDAFMAPRKSRPWLWQDY